MNREDVVQIFLDKILSTDWHYLQYHFAPYKKGYEHFLCASVVDACTKIESVMQGYTEEFSTRLASLANREMYQPHYEQIIPIKGSELLKPLTLSVASMAFFYNATL